MTKLHVRAGWDDTLLDMCRLLADRRADCRRARHAAIVFDESTKDFIALGYNGLASERGSCLGGDCARGLLSHDELPHLASYDSGPGICHAVHAEANALLRAGRAARGCTMFITGPPCPGCRVLMEGAGITRIVYRPVEPA